MINKKLVFGMEVQTFQVGIVLPLKEQVYSQEQLLDPQLSLEGRWQLWQGAYFYNSSYCASFYCSLLVWKYIPFFIRYLVDTLEMSGASKIGCQLVQGIGIPMLKIAYQAQFKMLLWISKKFNVYSKHDQPAAHSMQAALDSQ